MQRHIDDLAASPSHHFANPEAVTADPHLSVEDKRRILESWKLDARQLADATQENMAGGEETNLREVSKVLAEFNAANPRPARPKPRRPLHMSDGVFTAALLGVIGALIGAVVGSLAATAIRTHHA